MFPYTWIFHCIGSDHVVDKSHVCKESVWVWFGIEESALKVFAIALYPVSKYSVVGMSIEFLLVCYMKNESISWG